MVIITSLPYMAGFSQPLHFFAVGSFCQFWSPLYGSFCIQSVTFFGLNLFFETKFFLDPNSLAPIFFKPLIYFRPKFLWTQNLYGPKFLLTYFFSAKIFLMQNFLDPNLFWIKKHFMTLSPAKSKSYPS